MGHIAKLCKNKLSRSFYLHRFLLGVVCSTLLLFSSLTLSELNCSL